MKQIKEKIIEKFINYGKRHRKWAMPVIAVLALVLTMYYVVRDTCDKLAQNKFRRRLVCVLMAGLLFLQMGPLDIVCYLGVDRDVEQKEETYAATGSVDLKRLSGSGSAFMYYQFNEVNNFVPGTTYAFLDGVYGPKDAVMMLGSGAVLKAKSEKNDSLKYIQGWYGDSAKVKVYVDVVKKGKGFDHCSRGGLYSVPNSGTPTEYRYFCYRGGAQNAGPLYAYSYETATLTYQDVSATLNEVRKKGSKNPADYTVKISYEGKTLTLAPSSYTIQISDPNSDKVNIIVEDNDGNKITTQFQSPMTVAFNGNADGVTNVPSMQSAWRGNNLTLSTTTPVRSGYAFQNWKDSLTGTTYSKGSTTKLTQDLKLFAQWKDAQAPTVVYTPTQVMTGDKDEVVQSAVKAALTITDNEPVSECTVNITLPSEFNKTPGYKNVTVKVTDKAGNATTKTCSVYVDSYVDIKRPVFTEDSKNITSILNSPGVDPITESGFVWGVMNSPSITMNNGKAKMTTPVRKVGDTISVTANNLQKGVTYYARAYIIAGGMTYYSEEIPIGVGLPDYGKFTISNDGSKFKVTRDGGEGTQTVEYRTVNGSAVGGTHFEHKNGTLIFNPGEKEKIIPITEHGANTAYSGKPATAYTNTDRTYSMEIYHVTGGASLGDTTSAPRTMKMDSEYKVDRSVYTKEKERSVSTDDDNNYVVDRSDVREKQVSFINNRGYNNSHGNKNFNVQRSIDVGNNKENDYLKKTATGFSYKLKLHMTEHSWAGGYEHIWISDHEPNNLDGRNEHGDTISLDDSKFGPAHYTARWEIKGHSEGDETGYFPGASGVTWPKQSERSGRVSGGYVLFDPGATAQVWFTATGGADNIWHVNSYTDWLKVNDTQEPQLVKVAPMAGGTYKVGDSFTVSLIFDEIVDSTNSPYLSSVKVNTTWGEASYIGGANTNVLYFSGKIKNPTSNKLSVSGFTNPGQIKDMCNSTTEKATESDSGSTGATVDSSAPNFTVTSNGVENGTGKATIKVNADQSKTTALRYVWSDSKDMPDTGWVEASASELSSAKGSGLTLGIRKDPGSGKSDGIWYLHVIGTYGTTGATTHKKAAVNFGTPGEPAEGAAQPSLTVNTDNTNWATSRPITISAKNGTELKYRKSGSTAWEPLETNETSVTADKNGAYTFLLTAGDQTVTKSVQVTRLDTANPKASVGTLSTEDGKTVETAKKGVYTKITLPVTYSDSESGVTNVKYAWTDSTGTPSSWQTLLNNTSSPAASGSREFTYTATEASETTKYLHIKVTDKVGHTYTARSAAYKVIAETKVNNTPPTVSITGAPAKWTNDMATLIWNLGNYAGKNYLVTLPDGRTSVANKGNLLANQNGTYTVTVEDKTYGAENSASVTVDKLDFTPPAVTVTGVPVGWKNTASTIRLSISDSDSGVGKGYYKFVDSADEIPTTGLTEFSGTSKSISTGDTAQNRYLYYKCYDNTGDDTIGREANKKEGFAGPIQIDKQKVSIGFQVDGKTAVSGKAYPDAPDITVTLKDMLRTSDISGGIKSVTYQVGTAAKKTIDHSYGTKTVTDDTFTIPAGEIPDGAVDITVNTTDHAGNTSEGTYRFQVYNNSGIEVSSIKSPVYDGSQITAGTDFKVTVNGSRETPGYQYKKKGAADSSYADGLPKDAGAYTVKVSAAQDDTNHYRSTENTFDITIQQKEVGLSWGNTAFTYNGTAQKPGAAATGLVTGEGLTVLVDGAKEDSCEKAGVGNYTATARNLIGTGATDAANYKLPSANTHAFTIAPKPVTLSWANKEFIYDGTEKKPAATVNAGSLIEGDTCNVADIDGGRTDACEKAGVGSYTATAKTLDNKNYCLAEDPDTVSTAYVIAQKEAEIFWGSGEFGYDGTAKVPTAEVTNLCSQGSKKDVCKVAVSVSAKEGSALSADGTAVEFGKYMAKASGLSNGNYRLPEAEDQITKDFVIDKAAGEVSVKIPGGGWTYGDEPVPPTAEVRTGDYGIYGQTHAGYAPTYEYKEKDASDDTYTEEVPQKAGKYTVRLSYDETQNYAPASATADFTIAKRTVDIQWGGTAFTYNGTEQVPVATVGNIVRPDMETDHVDIQVSGGQKDSCVKAAVENHTAKAVGLSGGDAENYALPEEGLTIPFTIAQKEAELEFSNLEFTYSGMACLPAARVTNLCDGDTCSVAVTGEQTDAGTYTAEAASLSDSNYKLPDTGNETEFVILPKPLTAEDIRISVDSSDNSYPYNGSEITPVITVRDEAITAGQEAKQLVRDTDYTVDGTARAKNFGTYTLSVNGAGNYTDNVEVTWYITDPNDPFGTITIEDNRWTKFWNSLSFGLFFNKTEDVTITGEDGEGESGLKDIHYYVSGKELTGEEVRGVPESAWTKIENGGTFSIDPDQNVVIYAKIADNSGRTAYINSDGVVLDATPPVITGVADGGKYCSEEGREVPFTVEDPNLEKVTVSYSFNETRTTEVLAEENGTYTLPAKGSITLSAADKAGNENSMSLTVSGNHTYGEWATKKPGTCTEAGLREHICRLCGRVETEEIPAAHVWETDEDGSIKYTLDKMNGCVTEGVESQHCRNCSEIRNKRMVPATGHSFGEWAEAASECTGTVKTRVCEKCGTVETENAAGDHTWESEAATDKEATCTEDGSRSIHCSKCSATKDTEIIPAAGHKPEEGWMDQANEHWHVCSVCGTPFDQAPHAESDWIIEKEASGTEPGMKKKICTVCGRELKWGMIPAGGNAASGSIVKEVEVKEDSPVTEAVVEQDVSRLQETVLNEGERKAVLEEGTDIEIIVEVDRVASDKEPGRKQMEEILKKAVEGIKNTSSLLDEELSGEPGLIYVDLSMHKKITTIRKEIDLESGDMTTSTEETVEDVHEVDGDITITLGIPKEILHPKSVEYVRKFTVVRMHEGAGGTEIEALPTLKKDEMLSFATDQFSVYAIVYQDVAACAGGNHTWGEDYTIDKAATCTEEGSRSIHCKYCSEVKDVQTVPAAGHKYGDWKVVREATATAGGERERACEVCGNTVKEEIPAVGAGGNNMPGNGTGGQALKSKKDSRNKNGGNSGKSEDTATQKPQAVVDDKGRKPANTARPKPPVTGEPETGEQTRAFLYLLFATLSSLGAILFGRKKKEERNKSGGRGTK